MTAFHEHNCLKCGTVTLWRYDEAFQGCANCEAEAWDAGTTYDLGDEVIHTPRKVVTLTGFAWLWAKLTGKPTQWTEEGKPQVYQATVVPDVGSFDGWEERPRFDFPPVTDLDENWIKSRYEKVVAKNGPPEGALMFGGKPGHSYKIECNTSGRVFYGTADESGKVEAKP